MNQILVLGSLFLVIFFGFLAYKLKILTDSAAQNFNKFIFYFAAPAIIFSSLTNISKTQLSLYPSFVLINILELSTFTLVVFLFLKFFRIIREIRGSFLYTSISGNLIYFAYPILLSIFSKDHFNLGVVYSIAAVSLSDLVIFFLLGVDKRGDGFSLKKV